MIKFIFILTMWDPEMPDVRIVVDDLSPEQCFNMTMEYTREYPEWELGVPSCEPNVGQFGVGI